MSTEVLTNAGQFGMAVSPRFVSAPPLQFRQFLDNRRNLLRTSLRSNPSQESLTSSRVTSR
jgi:hypothetical protein